MSSPGVYRGRNELYMTPEQAGQLIVRYVLIGGPEVTDYANLSKAFTVVAKDPGLVEWMVRHMERSSTEDDAKTYYDIIPHIYRRPYGYAGDFHLLSKMYDMHDQLSKRRPSRYAFSKWDRYVASLPSTASVINRESYLLEQIGTCIERQGSASVLDIACGNGRLMSLLKARYPSVSVHGIDLEPRAICEAKHLRQRSTVFEVMNALKYLPEGKFDIVVSGGLCDYLSDALMERLIQRIDRQYHPKLIIMGNLDHHACEPLMSLLSWDLIYRSAFDLKQIGLRVMCWKDYITTVRAEPLGINLFLTMERTT